MKAKTTTDKIYLTLPTAYSQCSRKQVRRLAFWHSRRVPTAYLRARAFFYLTGLKQVHLKRHTYRYKKTQFKVTPEIMNEHLKKVDWLFEKMDITAPVYKRMAFRLAPDEELFNLTWAEFIAADIAAFLYHTSGEVHQLNTLCNILYRKGKAISVRYRNNWDGDYRIPFNEHTYSRVPFIWRWVPLSKKYTVFMYFNGCKEVLMQRFPNVFAGGTNSSQPIHPGESYLAATAVLSKDDVELYEALPKKRLYSALQVLDNIMAKNQKK